MIEETKKSSMVKRYDLIIHIYVCVYVSSFSQRI